MTEAAPNYALARTQDRRALIEVLQSSLYPDAKPESIEMLISYCEARGLDPLLKPAHIVGMSVKVPGSKEYRWRDVIMPGIGLYRIQAERSGNCAGISEPEFGPLMTEHMRNRDGNEVTVNFPQWCRVVARKLLANGSIVDYAAREYWLENYATDSGKSTAPNMMWAKRPYGQLAKCAEAQALRKAWPEIDAGPTYEEMAGKTPESIGPAAERLATEAPPGTQTQRVKDRLQAQREQHQRADKPEGATKSASQPAKATTSENGTTSDTPKLPDADEVAERINQARTMHELEPLGNAVDEFPRGSEHRQTLVAILKARKQALEK